MVQPGPNGITRLHAVFMGSPDFAATVLAALLKTDACEVTAVYTQPDRPCGRGQACRPTPVKTLALEQGLPVFQPRNFKAPGEIAQLAALKPDVLVVAAYGLLLPQAVLDVPRLMPINVHASLLPRHRGASPIQACILAGESVTGVTIMRMEAGLDTGPILLQRALRIGENEDAGALHDQLASLGADLAVRALEHIRLLHEIKQDDALATYAPKLTKADGHIDFTRPVQEIHNRIRAVHPWPGAFFTWTGGREPLRLTLAPGRIGPKCPGPALAPGTILGCQDGMLAIACTNGETYLTPRVTPEGKKPLAPAAFTCGYLNVCRDDRSK